MQLWRRMKMCIKLICDLSHMGMHLTFGVWRLSKLPQPLVTIFGGSRVTPESVYAAQANRLAQLLVDAEISILTGGGPGIMRAANCGAISRNGKEIRSIGIGVKGLAEELSNECAQEYIATDYFSTRKWLLTRYSMAFAVFPGGFGTLDEFAEIITLMQTEMIQTEPVVLIGVEYWKPLMQWINESALKNDLVKEEDKGLFVLTDDIDEAFQIIRKRCEECPPM